jgi:isoamylase
LTPSGTAMTEQEWADPFARSVAMLINGSIDPDCAEAGTRLLDDDFLVLINGWWEPLVFAMPAEISSRCWEVVCDTFDPKRISNAERDIKVGPRSLVICKSHAEGSSPETALR